MGNTVYQPEGLAKEIFDDRYTITKGETWEQASRRVAGHVASAEDESHREQIADEFYDVISSNQFMPGGRIWYGAGRPRAQLLNCFVIPTADSREGWGKTISDVIVISGMGGGVGINLSPIRPRGSEIKGTGGIATGAVSLMQMINNVGDVIVGGGGRRMALMLDLNLDHPDLLEFLDKKLDKKELNNANVSIVLNNDPHEFVKAVKEDGYITQSFNKEYYADIKARDVWKKIVDNAWNSGEPGVLNGYLANSESNISYYKPMVSTNPCGEIWLEEYGCCDLGALVLPRFVNDRGLCNWNDFHHAVKTAVRFLDNVLSVNEYPLPEIKENCENVRRIGLGIMGLHTMFIKMGIKYSSSEAKEFMNRLMETLKEEAYETSVDLAIEKGAFPAYDDRFLDSGFIQRSIPDSIQQRIKAHGIRNCALLTIAPTGTTGMVSDVSTGTEPLFAAAYWRRFYKPTADGSRFLDKELVINPLWDTVDPDLLEGAYDISPRDHFEMQKIAQQHIDNATSKTINLPNDYPVDTLGDLWLEYLPYLKGTTFYRAGSREGEPYEAIPLDEAKKLVAMNVQHSEGTTVDQNLMDCVGDTCEIPESLKPHIEVHLDESRQIQFV